MIDRILANLELELSSEKINQIYWNAFGLGKSLSENLTKYYDKQNSRKILYKNR